MNLTNTNVLMMIVVFIAMYWFLFKRNEETYYDVEFDELGNCNPQGSVYRTPQCGNMSFQAKNAITGTPYQQEYRNNMFSHFHTVNPVRKVYRPYLRN